MKELADFILLRDPNTAFILLGCLLLSLCSVAVGLFAVLRKKALAGDMLSHTVLPGVCLSFMISATKNPAFLLLGAFFSSWLSLASMQWLLRHTKIKEDAALAIVLSFFFGIGLALLTFIQHSGTYAEQSGLEGFIFGNAAALSSSDLFYFALLSLLVLLFIWLFFKEFTYLSFDPQFLASKGQKLSWYEFLLTLLLVATIVVGIQFVGVVLMASLLISPIVAARCWTQKMRPLFFISCAFAFMGVYAGTMVSSTVSQAPLGPWIVCFLSLFAILSFFLSRLRKKKSNKQIRRLQLEAIRKELLQQPNAQLADLKEKTGLPGALIRQLLKQMQQGLKGEE